jgi:hypothetical protein
MKSILEVIFLLEDGKTTTLELENLRVDFTEEAMTAVVNDMITKKAIVVGVWNITVLADPSLRVSDMQTASSTDAEALFIERNQYGTDYSDRDLGCRLSI